MDQQEINPGVQGASAEEAEMQARQSFLQQQATQFMNNIRTLKVAILVADQNGDLTTQFKNYLSKEFLMIAGALEVKK